MLERVIEERAKGDPAAATGLRAADQRRDRRRPCAREAGLGRTPRS